MKTTVIIGQIGYKGYLIPTASVLGGIAFILIFIDSVFHKNFELSVLLYLIIGIGILFFGVSVYNLKLKISDDHLDQAGLLIHNRIIFRDVSKIAVYSDFFGGYYIAINYIVATKAKNSVLYLYFFRNSKRLAIQIVNRVIKNNSNVIVNPISKFWLGDNIE